MGETQEHSPMTDDQIKYMVQRFLGWKLPENFQPDCGIEFDADAARKLNPRNGRYEPVGTNLFDAQQTEAMIRWIVAGMPAAPPSRGAVAGMVWAACPTTCIEGAQKCAAAGRCLRQGLPVHTTVNISAVLNSDNPHD